MPNTVLVTGDPICDHNYYRGNRATADSAEERGFRLNRTPGGALLLHSLIAETIAPLAGWQAEFGLELTYTDLPLDYHAFCLWEPQVSDPDEKDESKRFEVWRAVEPPLGYGQREPVPEAVTTFGKRKDIGATPEIVVIDDAGLDFRGASSRDRWPFPAGVDGDFCPRWLVLKLSGSIGEGDLWNEIIRQSPRNLIVIVSADQLRRRDVRLSRALSWEATVEDLLAELRGNPALTPLLAARHLIITFRSDGAFWLDNTGDDSRSSMLVFDAARAEGDWAAAQGKGAVFGYLSCFTAAVVRELCRWTDEEAKKLEENRNKTLPDFEGALGAGLGASRELRRLGHGRVKITHKSAAETETTTDNPCPGFPSHDIAARIHQPTDKFVSAPLPSQIAEPGKWMMLDEWQVHARNRQRARPHHEAALAVAVLGPDALERFPAARFGGLRTVDRQEIESLRNLRQMISTYQDGGPQKKPLSIGVFGPPGAGKSFGVMEICKAVMGEKVEVLTFNLSQFSDPNDLIGAFHQVRDKVLTGVMPVVFWDEFDSQNYRWLQYLLAPMQDGAFQHGQLNHPIGKCLFIFAGATSATFERFGPVNPNQMAEKERQEVDSEHRREIDRQWDEFVVKKGPDFKSRITNYLNVLGPNRRQICNEVKGSRQWADDPTDLCYPIRRAFFIRSQFKLKEHQRLQMDTGVLQALLQIPQYKAGARSLEFLCQHLRQSTADIPRRSHLPGHSLLDMHVDAAKFWEICERDLPFLSVAPCLAHHLHEAYRLRIQGRPEKVHLDVDFSKLDPDMQAANLGQALRIPLNLRLAGLRLVPGEVIQLKDLPGARKTTEDAIRKTVTSPDTLEILAEAEHNGWMVERMLAGWKFGRQRDDSKKRHPLIIPYNQLSEAEKGYDRETITGKPAPDGQEQFGYVDIVKTAGFRVEAIPDGPE